MLPYRILLADDHVLFRDAIKKAIAETPGLEVSGEVSDGLELMSLLRESVPDLVILDIGMPNLSGLEAAKEIKDNYPQVKNLILTMHKSLGHIRGAFEAKADGYLLKENAYGDLLNAIEVIKQGGVYISQLIHGQLRDFLREEKQLDQPKPLSPRELEVLSLVADGLSYKEISLLLDISSATVRGHIQNIKQKLNVKRTAQLIRYAQSEEPL
jgi:DNA-binding NarL/FixJ family response regulator